VSSCKFLNNSIYAIAWWWSLRPKHTAFIYEFNKSLLFWRQCAQIRWYKMLIHLCTQNQQCKSLRLSFYGRLQSRVITEKVLYELRLNDIIKVPQRLNWYAVQNIDFFLLEAYWSKLIPLQSVKLLRYSNWHTYSAFSHLAVIYISTSRLLFMKMKMPWSHSG